MKVTIYGIRNCDTMKKAFAWLESNGIEYRFHDYKREGAPTERLAAWSRFVGWEKLANTRGPTWRKIAETERSDLNEQKMLGLLAQHSSAIRRPIVEAGRQVLVGFDAQEYQRVMGQ